MNIIGPMSTRIGVSQRYPHLVDLIIRDSKLVSGYRLWLSRSLVDAYGTVEDSGLSGTGGDQVLEVPVGKLAQSISVECRGWASTAEVRRGQSSFIFDPDDFIVPNPPNIPNVPSDGEFLYARVQENRTTTGWAAVPHTADKNPDMPILGATLVVPNPSFFARAAGVMSLAGIAPAGSDCAVGSVPVFDPTAQKPMPMYIVFPRPMASLNIRNTDGANDLLVCFGPGQPMIKINKGDELLPTGSGYSLPGVTELILAMDGAGGGCAFSLDGMVSFQA